MHIDVIITFYNCNFWFLQFFNGQDKYAVQSLTNACVSQKVFNKYIFMSLSSSITDSWVYAILTP